MSLSLKSILLMMGIISLSGLFGCGDGNTRAIKKTGKQLEKIKEINYQLSLRKIKPEIAVEKIISHMKTIEKLSDQINEEEPIMELLTAFTGKWNSETQIFISLTDDKHIFMSEVTAFFLRGYVTYGDSRKPLFPLFKP